MDTIDLEQVTGVEPLAIGFKVQLRASAARSFTCDSTAEAAAWADALRPASIGGFAAGGVFQ
jgi:hypothetical protein